MKKTLLAILSLVFVQTMSSQDSTKMIHHEIGINAVSLIKQVISNNPSSTLPQLPYDIFYNFYFNNKIGARLGAGITLSNTETEIDGQNSPRTTNQSQYDVRLGLSYNFVQFKKITLNGFADGVYFSGKSETANTTTAQAFPDPVTTITTITSDKTIGVGGQIGVGVKYNFNKHLALYTEIPMLLFNTNNKTEVSIQEKGSPAETESSSIKSLNIQVFLPTTVYLVLRF